MSSGEAWLVAIIGGALAGIITAAAVMAIFNKPIRVKLWVPVGRAFLWPLTL